MEAMNDDAERQPPPGYTWAGVLLVNGPRDVRRADSASLATMPLEAAWREYKALASDRDEAVAVDAAVADYASSTRHAALVRYACRHYGPLPKTAIQVANLLGVSKRTVVAWRNPGALARALPLRPVEFLERLVCLLAPPPANAAPALPSTVVLRNIAGRRQLEICAAHACLASLEPWMHRVAPNVCIETGHARTVVRGVEADLRRIRDGILALERWQTLTPLAADVDAWIAAAEKMSMEASEWLNDATEEAQC